MPIKVKSPVAKRYRLESLICWGDSVAPLMQAEVTSSPDIDGKGTSFCFSTCFDLEVNSGEDEAEGM